MSNTKEVQSKPRLQVFVNLLFGVWPPCCATPSSSSSPSCVRTHKQYRAIPLATITMRISAHGFHFVSHIWDDYGAPLKSVLDDKIPQLADQTFNMDNWGLGKIDLKLLNEIKDEIDSLSDKGK